MTPRTLPILGSCSSGRTALAAAMSLALAPSALAQFTQEEFFRSVQKGVEGPSMGAGPFLAGLLSFIGLILLVVYVFQKLQEPREVKVLNSPRKLVQEVGRSVSIRSSELKQLRTLADTQSLHSPITLLLCPSLLDKVGRRTPSVDPRVVADILRKANVSALPAVTILPPTAPGAQRDADQRT